MVAKTGLKPTEQESIEEILITASRVLESDFEAGVLDCREAEILAGNRNKRRADEKKEPLGLEHFLHNAFLPLKKAGNAMDYNLRFAQVFYALEDYEKALHYLNEARKQKIKPQLPKVLALSVRSYVKLAEQAKEEKYLAEARNICEELLDNSRGGEFIEWTINELTDIQRKLFRYNKAMPLLKSSALKFPSFYLNIAEIHADLGKTSEMFGALSNFLSSHPDKWGFVEKNSFFSKYRNSPQYNELRFLYQPGDEFTYDNSCFSRWNTRGIFARLEITSPSRE